MMISTRLCALAFALVPLLLPMRRQESQMSGDEMAWRDLVTITDTDRARFQPGESPAGWRFWWTRDELFPEPGQAAPTQSEAPNYREVVCQPRSVKTALQESADERHRPNEQTSPDDNNRCEAIFLSPVLAESVINDGVQRREELIDFLFKNENKFRLPENVREIKTEWEPVERGHESEYFVTIRAGVPYGLVALHLRAGTKPESLWATWIHDSYLQSKLSNHRITDSFGGVKHAFPSQRLKTLVVDHRQETWLRYRLIGTQVGFNTRKHLANPLVEGPGFEKMSCVACHDHARIDDLGFNDRLKPFVVGPARPNTCLASTDLSWSVARAPKCKELGSGLCVNGFRKRDSNRGAGCTANKRRHNRENPLTAAGERVP